MEKWQSWIRVCTLKECVMRPICDQSDADSTAASRMSGLLTQLSDSKADKGNGEKNVPLLKMALTPLSSSLSSSIAYIVRRLLLQLTPYGIDSSACRVIKHD